MPITIKKFYERWEDVESKLIDITASPMLAISTLAEHQLKELYELKKDIDNYMKNPNTNSKTKIKGIRTTLFGTVSFESIESYANNHYESSSEKYLLEHGATFSDEYMEKNGLK